MSVFDFVELYKKVQEKEAEHCAWELWLTKFPTFTQETYISFDDFINGIKGNETHEQGVYIDQLGF
jgi:hypothetical protein